MSSQIEIPWYDAWTRWERDSNQCIPTNALDVTDEDSLPPPTESYDFEYTLPNDHTITLKLEGYHSDSEQTWNSTGLTLWRSSYYLCHFLVDHSALLMSQRDHLNRKNQMRILEVGSGLGRCGMLAHLLSKSNGNDETYTILTDGDTDTLKQLRKNVRDNIPGEGVDCKQLLWGNQHAKKFLLQQTSTFDLIIGSDLLYVTSVIQPLFETVFQLLEPKSGKFLMAHCCRRVGNDVTLDEILRIARKTGLEYKEELRNDEDIVLFSFRLQK